MSIRRRRVARTHRRRMCVFEQLESRVVLSAAIGSIPLEPPDLNNYGPLQDGFPPLSPLTPADTFTLQSRPDSDFTLFLDFDGYILQGTAWNSSYGSNIINTAFDIDNNPDSFSSNELAIIQKVWKRVAEDYAPFDLNVTTIDPGVDALIRSAESDTQWGMRVVITQDTFANCNCGGFAYIGSFGNSFTQPAFVFNESLDGISEAVSHEVGHTLNLAHDGTSSAEYYYGHGSGDTGWCPIMGAGYYKEVTTWDDGTYYNTSNGGSTANYGHGPGDLEVITTTNGFGFADDDHGDTFASATDLYVSAGNEVSAFGVIEQNTDLDVFSFHVGAGYLSLTLSPLNDRPNLDIWAGIYNASGTLVAQSNSLTTLSASFSNLMLSAGTYYLKVDGVSSHAVYDAATDTVNDPAPAPWQQASPTGYSQYGSLGQYAITGTIVPPSTYTLSVAALDAEKPEGDSGNTSFTFTVTRSGYLGMTASVDYAVRAAHPSTPGENYPWRVEGADFVGGVLPSGTVPFLMGESTKTITIDVVGDTTFEFDEPFFVVLSNPTMATALGTSAAVGTILSDENRLAFAPASPPVTYQEEGNAATDFVYTVTRAGDLTVTTTVDWQVTTVGLSNPASANDFVGNALPTGQVTFSPGDERIDVIVQVAGDLSLESDEHFAISLLNPQSTVPVTIHTPFESEPGTILNDDVASVVDYGDAPDAPYGTLAASNGARHTASYPLLGNVVDAEGNGQPATYANGDADDEDGVVFLDPLVPGATVRCQVTSSAGGGVLNYFFDFDGVGGFGNNANERFTATLSGGTETLFVVVPETAIVGATYARFRISSTGGLGPLGAAGDGEVEDYAITVFAAAPDRDCGDAPDTPYKTLITNHGANHAVGGPQLGSALDADLDGTPSDTATGDGRDDDGVRFQELLVVGQTSHAEITTTSGGVLDCFFDFDGDGTLGDNANETFHAILTGGTEVVPIAVPEDAVPGKTYARFRLSSAGYLAPIGFGFDGEVEDYQVMILAAPTAPSVMFENFESVTLPNLPSGWTSSSTTSTHWKTAAGNSDSPLNHAEVAATASISSNQLASAAVVIEPWVSALRFSNSYDLELYWDGGVLEISINGGVRQDIVDAGGRFLAGGYNDTIRYGYGNPLADRNAWTGDSGGYIDTIVALPQSAIGQSVRFYWIEGTDSGVGDVGWKIDTIQLVGSATQYAFDYGDAADPGYPTLSASSGAAHVAGDTVFLGTTVDADDDGQPTTDASGDDSDALGDDEDGVTFVSPLVPGQTAAVSITAQAGLLNAWLDFNDDGDWLDDGEYVFADVPLTEGTHVLEFDVPSSAVVTEATVARFRLSTQSALWMTGQAPDGEIEDHTVAIAASQVSATIVGRYIFYNNSAWDGDHAAADVSDDNAIAGDKQVLLPGQTATFANYTSYSNGINGLMIDVQHLRSTPTADDFLLRTGNNQYPYGTDPDDPGDDWASAPDPVSIMVRPGAGADGTDRVTLIWDDGVVLKSWLQVTMLANDTTGLAANEVFYVGNAVGESGNSATNTYVNALDEVGARNNPHGRSDPAPLDDVYDYNRDQYVNAVDEIIARNNPSGRVGSLVLLTAPEEPTSGGGAEGEGEAG